MDYTLFSRGFISSKIEPIHTKNNLKRSTNTIKIIISMMLISLAVLANFYISVLNGFDQSVQFVYFILIVIISISVCAILFIIDKWGDHRIYAGIISVVLATSIGLGFLGLEELNKVEVTVISPANVSSAHMKFNMSGVFKNVPENQDIWLYLVPLTPQKYPPVPQKYYPEPIPVNKLDYDHSNTGSWDYYGILGGMNSSKNTTKPFQIGFFLSNKTDKNYIIKEIEKINGSTKGMNRLPGRTEDLGIQTTIYS